MKNILLLIGCLLIISATAQNSDSLKHRPAQVSFFYPLGTNGINSPSYSNNISFNILYGINGGVEGAEFGGLVNVNTGDVNGIQMAGIANVNAKKSHGLIFGGIANIMQDSCNAMAFAGIANINGTSAMGMQFAGISNTVNGDFTGGQFAGISNTVNGNYNGAQVAGISNVNNGQFTGLQIAGISNLNNGDLQGSQIGLINVAKNVSGFQMGLINVAESFEKGVPFGLVNYVKNGFHAIEISGGEAIYGNLSFKLGVDQLYTIYKFGYASNNSENHFTYGLGIGGMVPLSEKARISIDLSANHIIEPSYSPQLNLLSRADLAFRYHFNDHIGLFAGPSFNVYVAETPADGDISPLNVPYAIYEEDWWNGNGKTSLWIGFNAGISFMF